MRLREIYGGAARNRSLTVAGVSAVGGAITGVVIGTMTLAGASSPRPPAPVKPTVHKHVRNHRTSPTPYVDTTFVARTPSHSPSASPTPSKSATPRPTPTSSSSTPAPSPSTTVTPTTAPTSSPPATSSPADGGAPHSPGRG